MEPTEAEVHEEDEQISALLDRSTFSVSDRYAILFFQMEIVDCSALSLGFRHELLSVQEVVSDCSTSSVCDMIVSAFGAILDRSPLSANNRCASLIPEYAQNMYKLMYSRRLRRTAAVDSLSVNDQKSYYRRTRLQASCLQAKICHHSFQDPELITLTLTLTLCADSGTTKQKWDRCACASRSLRCCQGSSMKRTVTLQITASTHIQIANRKCSRGIHPSIHHTHLQGSSWTKAWTRLSNLQRCLTVGRKGKL